VAALAKRRFPEVAVALTIGGDLAQAVQFNQQRMRAPGLTRLDAVLACQADWVAVHHRTARPGLLEACLRHGIKTMVWTVNRHEALARWLSDPRVDVVVTNRPVAARTAPSSASQNSCAPRWPGHTDMRAIRWSWPGWPGHACSSDVFPLPAGAEMIVTASRPRDRALRPGRDGRSALARPRLPRDQPMADMPVITPSPAGIRSG